MLLVYSWCFDPLAIHFVAFRGWYFFSVYFFFHPKKAKKNIRLRNFFMCVCVLVTRQNLTGNKSFKRREHLNNSLRSVSTWTGVMNFMCSTYFDRSHICNAFDLTIYEEHVLHLDITHKSNPYAIKLHFFPLSLSFFFVFWR